MVRHRFVAHDHGIDRELRARQRQAPGLFRERLIQRILHVQVSVFGKLMYLAKYLQRVRRLSKPETDNLTLGFEWAVCQ